MEYSSNKHKNSYTILQIVGNILLLGKTLFKQFYKDNSEKR